MLKCIAYNIGFIMKYEVWQTNIVGICVSHDQVSTLFCMTHEVDLS